MFDSNRMLRNQRQPGSGAGTGSLPGRFIADRRGNVAIMFGMSVLILSASVGGAIDVASWQKVKNQMQSALDTATLAGGRTIQVNGGNESSAIFTATAYMNELKPKWGTGGTTTFSVIENGTVLRGVHESSVPTPFLGILGILELPVSLQSEAVLAQGGNAESSVEISLMLDTTGSMAGQKIVDLKVAAKDLIDIVVWDDQSTAYSKVALAPFGARVNVGSYIRDLTHLYASYGGELPRPCVTERTGAHAFTDTKPTGNGDDLSAYAGDTGNAAKINGSNYNSSGTCAGQTIMPLSNNKATLKSHIDTLGATGATAGQLGTAWAWYLLSPKWNGIWTGTSQPGPYSDLTTMTSSGGPKLRKIAVLMSDGTYNTYGGQNYGDGSSMSTTISNNAVTLCTNMKAAGIVVYAVGFQLDNTLAVNTLKSCASREPDDPVDAPSYFYNSSTGEELKQAFRDIALKIATLRLRK